MNHQPAPARFGHLVVVGALNVDRSWRVPAIPRAGQTVVARDLTVQFGGKGGNQAVAAARQEAAVIFIGAVGNDADGRDYLEHLRVERIDTHLVAKANQATGFAHIYVDAKGENLIVVDLGANDTLVRSGLGPALQIALPGAGAMVLQLECGVEAAVLALNLAAQQDVKAILNASPYSGFPWGTQTIYAVIVNEHECLEFFQRSPQLLEHMDAWERGAFLERLRIEHLVVTCGSAPTLLLSRDGAYAVPTHPVAPVDTVGAGDAFAGVLASLVARGMALPVAVAEANVAAALSTLVRGAQSGIPSRVQVQAAHRAAGSKLLPS